MAEWPAADHGSGEIAKKAREATNKRKSSTTPRIINRLANLTGVVSTFESRRGPIQSRADTRAPRDLYVKASPLFPAARGSLAHYTRY